MAKKTAPADSRSPRHKDGEMEFQLRELPEPLRLKQVIRGPMLYSFLKLMAIIGGFLVFVVFGYAMFRLGSSGSNSASTPPTAIYQPAVPQQPSKPHWASREECEDYYVFTLHEAPAGHCR